MPNTPESIIEKQWSVEDLEYLPQFTMYSPSRFANAHPTHSAIEMDGIEIDEELTPLIQALWDDGVQTGACCQGSRLDYHLSMGAHGSGYILFPDFDQAVNFFRTVTEYFTHEQGRYKITLASMDSPHGQAVVNFPPLFIEQITKALIG
jgi:hypothetical protein